MISWQRISRMVVALAALLLASGDFAQVPQAAPSKKVAATVISGEHALEATDLNSWLDGYIPHALQTGDIAGAVVVVVKDGQVLVSRGYGWADIAARRPVDPARTLFRVGSVSKLFTWTAVMQQVEAGKLDLDTDVNHYLDFRIPPFHGQPVTLRQIMTHTAGFELAGKDTITFGKPMALDAYLKRWVPERIYAPGTTPAYSNWGAALAGYIVQRASGTPYATYIEQRIFAPLGMHQASFRQPLPDGLLPSMARGYALASAPPPPFEVIGPAPAGALSASGLDMAHFMIAHLEDGRGLMTPQTAAMMHSSPLDKVNPRSLIPPLNRAELGFIESNINGHEAIGHGGDTQNFKTLLELFTSEHVGIFVSFNSAGRNGAAAAVRNQIFDDFADRYFPAPTNPSRIKPDLARQHAQLMAGQWQGSGRAESSFLALATFAGQKTIALTPEGGLSIPSLTDAGGAVLRWDEVAPFVWQARNSHERLAAVVANGEVMRWSIDSLAPTQVFDRVPFAQSSVWLMPALGISLMVLLLTVLYWPASWFIRRRYRAPVAVKARALLAYRTVRIMSLLALLVLGGWIALFTAMFSNFDLLSARSDPWLWLLQISGWIVFAGAVITASWNAMLTWQDRRRWPRKLWSMMLVLAAVMILYFAWQSRLLARGVNY